MSKETPDPEELRRREAEAVKRATERGWSYALPDGTRLRAGWTQFAFAERMGMRLDELADAKVDDRQRLIPYQSIDHDMTVLFYACKLEDQELFTAMGVHEWVAKKWAFEWFEGLGVKKGDDQYVEMLATYEAIVIDYFVTATESEEPPGNAGAAASPGE